MGTLLVLLTIMLAKWLTVSYENKGHTIEADRWRFTQKCLWWLLGLAVIMETMKANEIFF